MKSTYNLAKVFGIQFRFHFSWLFIFLLVTVFLAWQVFPPVLADQPAWFYAVMGIVTSLLFFISVLVHELAHSLVARSQGIPIHGITLFVFGGAAQMTREAAKASDEFKMALAGPAISLLLAAFFGFIYVATGAMYEPVALMAYWLAFINVVLAVFNMLPGFPLDGGRLLRAAIWHYSGDYMKAIRLSTIAGRIIGYLIIVAGLAYIFLDSIISGLWMMFIGWFLADTAQLSYRQAQMQQVLKGFKISEVMTGCPVVDGNISVAEFRSHYGGSGKHCYLVSEGERVEGYVTSHNAGTAFPHEREDTSLHSISTKLDRDQAAKPGQDVLSVIQQMYEQNINELPVLDDDRVLGMVLLDDLIQYVNNHSAVKGIQRKR